MNKTKGDQTMSNLIWYDIIIALGLVWVEGVYVCGGVASDKPEDKEDDLDAADDWESTEESQGAANESKLWH